MNEKDLTITYHAEFSDVLSFALYHYTHSIFGAGFVTLLVILRNRQLIFSDLPEGTTVVGWCTVFFLNTITMLAVLSALCLVIVFAACYLKKNIFTTYTLSLLEDSLIHESAYGGIEVNYSAVVKTRVTGRHLFIYRTPTTAIIVPKRAFKSPAQWSAFYSALQSKLR